ncbi:hypothetical protein Nepgr_023191 [Nepenthes gracilis]|uniref:Uncharacterized protein n=1 Tax=Nepenthes gracilis TaxID=150966 RepID=A0AAD3T2F5_NEPGR|nr:hypothetical protein Nepgr_023191 [Nepenthes gracilis]
MGGDDHVLADFAGAILGAALPGASSSLVCLMLLWWDLDGVQLAYVGIYAGLMVCSSGCLLVVATYV